MIRPGRGIADRAYPRLVESEPAWVPDPPPLRAPVGLYIAGAVALSCSRALASPGLRMRCAG